MPRGHVARDQLTVSTPIGRRHCLGCGGQTTVPTFRELVTCPACGLVYFPRRLSDEEAIRLYSADYFHGTEYLDYVADRRVHEANFRARLRQLTPWVPPGRRVFEIGCAYGFFLNLARQRWPVRGCDIARQACDYARSEFALDVQCADFARVAVAHGEIDAFCMWDTIEHLDPAEQYLARIAELLKPGGILALTTGDIGSWLARRQGPAWRQIHPPTHIWYFSRATIRRTLDRFGFDVVWDSHVGLARSLGQIVYGLTSLGRQVPSLLHRLVVRSGLAQLPIWLNTFDLMMVVARRRSVTAP